jgi:hypothetical protein
MPVLCKKTQRLDNTRAASRRPPRGMQDTGGDLQSLSIDLNAIACTRSNLEAVVTG